VDLIVLELQAAGGAGRVTAEWMINGYMNEDLYSLDIKRFQKFHSNKKFIMNRVTETLGESLRYALALQAA
jgi:4-methylaminobutanoate oxidase (formaldehyde-forming)